MSFSYIWGDKTVASSGASSNTVWETLQVERMEKVVH